MAKQIKLAKFTKQQREEIERDIRLSTIKILSKLDKQFRRDLEKIFKDNPLSDSPMFKNKKKHG